MGVWQSIIPTYEWRVDSTQSPDTDFIALGLGLLRDQLLTFLFSSTFATPIYPDPAV